MTRDSRSTFPAFCFLCNASNCMVGKSAFLLFSSCFSAAFTFFEASIFSDNSTNASSFCVCSRTTSWFTFIKASSFRLAELFPIQRPYFPVSTIQAFASSKKLAIVFPSNRIFNSCFSPGFNTFVFAYPTRRWYSFSILPGGSDTYTCTTSLPAKVFPIFSTDTFTAILSLSISILQN